MNNLKMFDLNRMNDYSLEKMAELKRLREEMDREQEECPIARRKFEDERLTAGWEEKHKDRS